MSSRPAGLLNRHFFKFLPKAEKNNSLCFVFTHWSLLRQWAIIKPTAQPRSRFIPAAACQATTLTRIPDPQGGDTPLNTEFFLRSTRRANYIFIRIIMGNIRVKTCSFASCNFMQIKDQWADRIEHLRAVIKICSVNTKKIKHEFWLKNKKQVYKVVSAGKAQVFSPCAVPVTSGSICMEKHVPLKRSLCMKMDEKHRRAVSERPRQH